MIQRIVSSNYAELTLTVLNGAAARKQPSSTAVWQRRDRWFYEIFNTIDEKLFLRGSSASAPVDASDMFSRVPVLTVEPNGGLFDPQLSSQDVDKIKSYQLDILVKLGFGRLQGEILSAAKYGLWSYRWGDHRKIEDGLIGFWEVVREIPETGASLQRLSAESESPATLFESWFFTYPFSPARNRNYILWAASAFLPRQMECLHRSGGEVYFREPQQHVDRSPQTLQSNKVPSNFETLWILGKLVFKNIGEAYQRKFRPKRWELLYSFEPDAEKKLASFRKITPPKDRFWADPHVIHHETRYYVFLEEYPYETQRGHIAVLEMNKSGDYKPPVTVLREEYHLSFPSVFHWMGHYYMIPESSENKTIDLYECTEFPYQWQHKMTLMKDVKAVDTTVLYAQGKWWLFTAMAEQQAAAPQVELFLFYSNELFSDQWNPHPMNPIISDVKKARAAGSIFTRDGRWFRPSQYGSSIYGHGFDLNEILTLTETQYAERTVTTVRPEESKSIIATHTYTNQGNLTVIDALTRQMKEVSTS